MRNFFRRIKQRIGDTGRSVKRYILSGLEAVTFFISRTATATVFIFGALVGAHTLNGGVNVDRLLATGMAFIIGLPLGIIIFGQQFNLLYWLAICTITLFSMNLHNVWETARSLKNGGLDYYMTRSALDSVNSVTPDEEKYRKLQKDYTMLYKRVEKNSLREGPLNIKPILGSI
jgi:hypothetical protein